jgi:multicomponent Na+:H+ antiporter subunit F
MTPALILAGQVLLAILALAMALAAVRLGRGPSLPDRVVAFDVVAAAGVAMAALAAVLWQAPVLLDVAMVLAVIAFIGTVAVARYLEGKARR